MGDAVTRTALMAGASFVKDIKNVQGMHAFAESGYWRSLAMHLLDREKLAELGKDTENPASRHMSGWLMERWDHLPDVLAEWRQAGLRLARSKSITLPVPNSKAPDGPSRRTTLALAAPGARRGAATEWVCRQSSNCASKDLDLPTPLWRLTCRGRFSLRVLTDHQVLIARAAMNLRGMW